MKRTPSQVIYLIVFYVGMIVSFNCLCSYVAEALEINFSSEVLEKFLKLGLSAFMAKVYASLLRCADGNE